MRTDRKRVARAFGVALRHARVERSISQEALALKAQVDRTFVSRAERGERQPALTTVFLLSKALDLNAADLVAATEKALKSQ
jgi:transcriptional regulator with XRE-family HTH domain